MTDRNNLKINFVHSTASIGDLEYGTLISGYHSCPNAVHMKVCPKVDGNTFNTNTQADKLCLIVNLKWGTTMLISSEYEVRVHTGVLTVSDCEDLHNHLKSPVPPSARKDE